MKSKMTTLSTILAAALFVNVPLYGADGAEQTSMLSSGKYTATLSPNIGPNTARQIESQLKKIKGIKSVSVKPNDSTVHFVVKENVSLDVAKLNDEVSKTAPGVILSSPKLESAASNAQEEPARKQDMKDEPVPASRPAQQAPAPSSDQAY